jgi:OmcA/MtrC family decaheme c-type cytochrome
VVSFNVKIDNNAAKPYAKLDNTSSYFFAADLVPAGTVAAALDGAPQSTAQFERWAFERTGTFGSAFNYPTDNTITVRNYAFGTFDNTNAATGDYTYTFYTPLGSTTPYDNALHFSAADIQRVWVRVAGTPSNTYTGGVGFRDFTLSGTAPGYTVTNLGYLARQFVTIEACQKCHGPKNQVMDHASSYMDISGCVICHSPITNANNGGGGSSALTNYYMVDLWLGKMIHRIHDGKGSTLTHKPQADAVFPQDIRNCVACHSNPSGKDLGPVGAGSNQYAAGNQLDQWKNHPSTAYCGTCHVGFPLTSHNGGAHPPGASSDPACAGCHPATGAAPAVATVHDTSPEPGSFNANPKNVPEFNVTLTLSPVKSFYVSGDNILVTATLKKHADNTAVATAVYTNTQGLAGITDNALRSASLAVYGPRALPKSILNLPVSPTTGLPPQSANLFIGSKTADNVVNARVLTDNTAFRYKLTIPTGVKAGTYGVRVRFGDYGYVADNNYKVESVAFQTIQIGSATVEKKVAGDICVNCHGAPPVTFEGHNARHVVVWDTDQCNSCHDYSGNHAATLSNRVHAVHSANTLGDMLNTQAMQTTSGGFNAATIDVDWSDIGYPQNINNCATCHASGNTSYRSVVHEVSCLGCHGDNIYTGGASNHMLQSGGDWPLVK